MRARPRLPAVAPAPDRRRPGGASGSRRCSSPRARTPAPCRVTRRHGRSERATARVGSRCAASVTVRSAGLDTLDADRLAGMGGLLMGLISVSVNDNRSTRRPRPRRHRTGTRCVSWRSRGCSTGLRGRRVAGATGTPAGQGCWAAQGGSMKAELHRMMVEALREGIDVEALLELARDQLELEQKVQRVRDTPRKPIDWSALLDKTPKWERGKHLIKVGTGKASD